MPEGKRGWDETDTQWRYRIQDPGNFIQSSFRNKTITTGVTITIAKKTEDGPMEVQSIGFKKSTFETKAAAKKWLADHPDIKKTKGEGASMIDLENLTNYIIVRTGDKDPQAYKDLREQEGDFGAGVYLLWSDEAQSIVAFAFEPGLFTQDEATEWVSKAKEPRPMSIQDVLQYVGNAMAVAYSKLLERTRSVPVLARAFDETRRLVQAALDAKYPSPTGPEALAVWPWIVDLNASRIIYEYDNKRYTMTYSVEENDTVTFGDPEEVKEQWVREDGSPVMLHAFAVHLGSGEEADEDDDLIWKELIHPGKWFKATTGRLVEVTAEMIQTVFDAWSAGLPKLISVPTDHHHDSSSGIVPVEKNRGFVEKLKMVGDKLFGGFRITDPEVAYGVQVGNIADVSVYLQPNVTHPSTGDTYGWILEHVLLTNDPLAQDLAPFGAVPASTTEGMKVVERYEQRTERGEKAMSEVTITHEEKAELDAFKGLGMSAEDIKTLASEREQIQAQAQANRQNARNLEITQVVRAMEGVEAHDGVTRVENTRHYPVLCVAVEKALREQPEALALAVTDEGKASLDAVVLSIVNAIPAEGRMALVNQPTRDLSPRSVDPSLIGEDEDPTNEQIDALADSIGV